jgi:hypothetical protein
MAAEEGGTIMRFYIASKLENVARVRQLAEELENWGWKCTYKWYEHGKVLGSALDLATVASEEYCGVARAELFIALLPGGRGTHVELGIAHMAGCSIVLHSEDPAPFDPALKETCSFYWLLGVERICCPFLELPGRLKQRYEVVIKV